MKKYNRAVIYVIAHQDDWQLFMNPEVGNDIRDPNCKTVLIHTTAGDAGRDRKYWMARESGAAASVTFNLSINQAFSDSLKWKMINKKKVFYTQVASCFCYFLRLPDGAYDGDGFQMYGYQSLMKLKMKHVLGLKTVDEENYYASWSELVGVVEGIIREDLTDVGHLVTLNMLEPDATINPQDHSDHHYSSLLLADTCFYNIYTKRAFLTYSTYYKDRNLAGKDLVWKVGMFTAYHWEILKDVGHSTIAESDDFFEWATRAAYYREIE